MGFEQALQSSLFSQQSEKTFIDKLLAKEDTNRIREIIRKPKLKKEELLEILYLLSGTEAKLLNLGEWDRYVLLKFFVWIREIIKVVEFLSEYIEDLNKRENLCYTCEKYDIKQLTEKEKDEIKDNERCKCKKPDKQFIITARTKRLLHNNERLIEHNAKFLIDLYLNIGRTTLSLGATGILEFLKTKFEMIYPQGMPGSQMERPQDSGIMSLKTGRRGRP